MTVTDLRGVALATVLRWRSLGLSVIALQHRSKQPALPSWEEYQTRPASEDELRTWFGNGEIRNAGIVLGPVSGFVVIESDSDAAERWCAAHLPETPLRTRSARGVHRYYRLPTGHLADITIPATFTVSDGTVIEIKRQGQYVVAPGSVHPSGHLYVEDEPWPDSLDGVPEFPVAAILESDRRKPGKAAPPLPEGVSEGGRNATLFREATRLRRLGLEEPEILAALTAINAHRCDPPLDLREVETIAHSSARYEPAADTFPTTEAGDAEFFAALYGDRVRYDFRRGRWVLSNGHHWLPQSDGEVNRLALEAVRARQRAAVGNKDRLRWALGGEARSRQTNLLALVQSVKPIADAGDNWDADPWLLGVPNGVVDLRTGELRAGRPEDRITMRTRAPFDPAATCPLWDRTLAEIFGNDDELTAYVDRFIGYSLTGDCREEALPFCWGTGANGKGTLMNTLGWLLGDYADDLPFSALELHERSGIPNDIAKIVGKRFVTSSETGETKRLNEARVKALTGRDPITARFLHREFFTFQPSAKFWLATNQKPIVRDTSLGFWRRIHLIPFTRSFAGSPDLQLKEKLRAEGPGILARAVRGCLAWQREGLNPPALVREATNSYRADSMPLARFLDGRCLVAPEARATFGQLFAAYVKWCSETREQSRLSRREFSDALHERFQTDPTSKRNVQFVGIGLLDLFNDGDAL